VNRTAVLLYIACSLFVLLAALPLQASYPPGLYAEMKTNKGLIVLKLEFEKTPLTVCNFVGLAEGTIIHNRGRGKRFYDGLKFHRVISNFMIQGGGYTADMERKTTREPIKNEADNGVKNERGTIAMARTMDVDSATAQFFINVEINPNLDHSGKANSTEWGYAVFGKVLEGMEVVDDIRFVETSPRDQPLETVLIESVEIH